MKVLDRVTCCARGIGRLLQLTSTPQQQQQLRAASTDYQAALRPFYFAVHPDFFGDHPKERTVNENSLKQLSEYLQRCDAKQTIPKATLPFYLRQTARQMPAGAGKLQFGLRLVTVLLDADDISGSLRRLLESCNLPIPRSPNDYTGSWGAERSHGSAPERADGAPLDETGATWAATATSDESVAVLRQWISYNGPLAREHTKRWCSAADECAGLSESLKRQLHAADIRWDCSWRQSYYLVCLRSLEMLCNQSTEASGKMVGRRLVFGNDTGITASGDIMLGCEDVPSTWLHLIRNVRAYDSAVAWIPQGEQSLSELLGGAAIVRKTVQPVPMASEYSRAISELVGRLRVARHATYSSASLRHNSLIDVEVMVSGFTGELRLSPSGQFFVPASTRTYAAVRFIESNAPEARALLQRYRRDMQRAAELMAMVQDAFQLLRPLTKDTALTWPQVISCCEALLHHSNDFEADALKGLRLKLTPYYALTADGEMCLPWNWICRGGSRRGGGGG